MTRRRWDSSLHLRPRPCIYLNYVEHCWYMTNINTTDSFRAATHDYSHYWSICWICLQSINQLETEKNEKMHKRDIIACFVKQMKTQRYLIYNGKKGSKHKHSDLRSWNQKLFGFINGCVDIHTHWLWTPAGLQHLLTDDVTGLWCIKYSFSVFLTELTNQSKLSWAQGDRKSKPAQQKKQHHIFCKEDRKW